MAIDTVLSQLRSGDRLLVVAHTDQTASIAAARRSSSDDPPARVMRSTVRHLAAVVIVVDADCAW